MLRSSLRMSSVRARLTLWNVGVLALALLIFGGAIRAMLLASLSATVDHHLTNQIAHIRAVPQIQSQQTPSHLDQHVFRPVVFNLQGKPLTLLSPTVPWDPKTMDVTGSHEVYSTVKKGSDTLRILSASLMRNGRQVGVIQAVVPVTENITEVARISRVLLTLIPLALIAAAIGGAFLTERALRPVRAISQAASGIGAANLSGRLTVAGNDELAELACTFNAMLARLEDAFTQLTQANERQRRFTADASHELRTPLTVIKAHTSLALMLPRTADEYRQALEAIDHSADRTEKIVQDLLLLARVDAGQLPLKPQIHSLRKVLDAAKRAFVPPGCAEVSLDIPNTLYCLSDREALIRLFGNLLFNATQHTPPTGQIRVSAVSEDGYAVVRVTDTGEGIAPEHLPHLGERFYRVDAARSGSRGGTGLGLAICQGIAEAHGGKWEIASEIGVGTTVTVTLPLV
jgi:heavy metal sensor kinase